MTKVSTANITALESLQELPTYQAGVAQAAAYRLLKKFTDVIIAKHDLTMMQWYIIGTVYDAGSFGLSMSNLAKTLDTGLPYITNTINVLEARGIVERVAVKEDNRIKHVVLKRSYGKTVQRIEADIRAQMRGTLYQNIEPSELLIYIKVLYKLTALLDETTADD